MNGLTSIRPSMRPNSGCASNAVMQIPFAARSSDKNLAQIPVQMGYKTSVRKRAWCVVTKGQELGFIFRIDWDEFKSHRCQTAPLFNSPPGFYKNVPSIKAKEIHTLASDITKTMLQLDCKHLLFKRWTFSMYVFLRKQISQDTLRIF